MKKTSPPTKYIIKILIILDIITHILLLTYFYLLEKILFTLIPKFNTALNMINS